MDIKLDDRVRFKESLALGAGLGRRGQVGTVVAVHDDLPGQVGRKVDIKFDDGGLEHGIGVAQLERA